MFHQNQHEILGFKVCYQNEHERLLCVNIEIIITINTQDEQMQANRVINLDF